MECADKTPALREPELPTRPTAARRTNSRRPPPHVCDNEPRNTRAIAEPASPAIPGPPQWGPRSVWPATPTVEGQAARCPPKIWADEFPPGALPPDRRAREYGPAFRMR